MRILGWILLACAALIGIVGLIVDGTRAGEDPNLAPLYLVAVVLGLLGMAPGQLEKRGDAGRG